MRQVEVRGGVFGPKGRGSGIFSAADRGFGGLGSEQSVRCIAGLGAFPSAYPNGYPTAEYTVVANDTGTKIAKLITGDGNRWPELLTVNPTLRSAQYGIALPAPGRKIKLPPAWVAQGGSYTAPASSPAPAPSGGGLPAGLSAEDWKSMVQGFAFVVNDILEELGYSTVRFDGVVDGKMCGAVDFIAKQIGAGARPGSGQAFADMVRERIGTTDFGTILTQACRGATPWVAPVKVGGGAPAVPPPRPQQPPPPPPLPDEPGDEQCWVEFSDRSPAIRKLQIELNAALDAAGYEGIPVTGQYDPSTCGGVFVMKGSFKPSPATGCAQFVIPLECPEMEIPRKKGGEKSGFSTAWMLGGFAVAAAIATAVSLRKKH